jgi:hypothetical protein
MDIRSLVAETRNKYTYNIGVKLKTEQRYDPNYMVIPSNDGLSDYKNTDYAGNIIYETVKNGLTTTSCQRRLL